MKKKIIIFGATGNVGSYLLKYALEYFDKDEFEIIASGRRETDFFTKRGIKYYSVDLTNEKDFEKLPTENVYAVMLLAAQIPSYMDKYEPKKYVDSIINGGYNVLEYCRKKTWIESCTRRQYLMFLCILIMWSCLLMLSQTLAIQATMQFM